MAQNDNPVIRVTLEDLDKVSLPEASGATATPGTATAVAGARSYGNVNAAEPTAPELAQEKGRIFLQGWFYLGAAGLLGTVIGWGIFEPWIADGAGNVLIEFFLIPTIVAGMLTGFATAESIVERSMRKAVMRFLVALPLGAFASVIFMFGAGLLYNVGSYMLQEMGALSERNPAHWVIRGIAWMVFGIAGGLIYGLIGGSLKKAIYGVIGGVIGAGLGGVLFDPIALGVQSFVAHHGSAHAGLAEWLSIHGGAVSRGIGFGLFGLATGAAIGFVESALKDRWLYVNAGPLAGKQFILYKPQTTIGSSQQCDIYLFKDSSIAPQHAMLETRGNQVVLRASQPVYVSGMPTQSRVLLSGDTIQIGRYQFRYNERTRS